MEHNQFVGSDLIVVLAPMNWALFHKDDSDGSQTSEEACIDDENLFNPLMIQTVITDVSTMWEEIDQQTYECYIDYITCDLDPNSWPMEDYLQMDQIDEDVPDIDDLLPINIIEGDDCYYSYDYFGFFDT